MLSAQHQKFAEAIISELPPNEAYLAAYPGTKVSASHAAASRLLKTVKIQDEINRIRRAAEVLAGGCVLTLAKKRQFLYELVTTPIENIGPDSYLCQSYKRSDRYAGTGEDAEKWTVEEFKVPDKLAAIKLDNDLGGDGADAALAITITRAWK